MAVLRGQAARDWIAQNPNKGFTDMRSGQRYNVQAQPQQQEPERSKFMNLVLGLSKPFRQGAGIAGEFGGTIGDLIRMSQGGQAGGGMARELGNILLTEEEERKLQEDPLKVGLKSGAGVASYGIGAGGLGGAVKGGSAAARIGSAAKLGALGGGLGGFGYSEEGEELGGTLKGAALGGVIGAGLQGVGEGAAALKARGKGTPKPAQFKPASDQATRELGLSKSAVEDLGGWTEAKKYAAEFYGDAGQGLGKMNSVGFWLLHL